MDIELDTEDWLGSPTPIEMYKHHCALLEDELIRTQAMLRRARANVAGLVQMNDALLVGKVNAKEKLAAALTEIDALKERCSFGAIQSMKIVAQQRDELLRENQRIKLELNVLKGPSA